MIKVKCHTCGKSLEVPEEYAGKSGKCNSCGGTIRVPMLITRKHIVVLVLVFLFLCLAWSVLMSGYNPNPIDSIGSEKITTEAFDGSKNDPAIREGVTCDIFNVSAELNGDILSFRLETDLPDNADVVVTVSRLYFEKGDANTAYSREYFKQKGKVAYWRTERTCSVADSIFLQSLQEQIDTMASLSMPFEVAQIADEIEVSYVLPAVQDSPEFGNRNANLRGKMVPASDIKSIDAVVQIKRPLGQTGNKTPRAQTASHDTLEIGKSYLLSDTTPLMPEFEPAEPLLAIQNRLMLPAGTTLFIHEKREKEGVPWYGVEAFQTNGSSVGKGWINSIALMGQSITKAD